MGLTSSLFSGVSGLAALGNSMTVIGDNIANVNTVGFKSSRVLFQDILSQTVATQSGSAQVGRGTSLGDVTAAFDQGSFESTESATDLAVGGEGFFIVRDPNNAENQFYTRAGSFRFDKDGNFVNPAGYLVRGWELARNETTGDVEDIGSITDIKLANFTSPPEATDRIKVIANLDAMGDDNSAASTLSTAWDGTLDSPIGDTAYEYQSTIKVYDSLGSTHDITIYFDNTDVDNQYEFIVTCNPAEDERAAFAADSGRGLLGRGTLQFTSSGVLGNAAMTFERLDGVATWTAQDVATDLTNQHFTFESDFLGGGASTTMAVELNFGTGYDGATWVPDSLSTTQFSSASTTVYQTATGYGAGDLQSISVDVDGAITGQYSNGQVTPLFRVALAKFQNSQGLFKEGGNLFRATRNSGESTTGKPGANGLGSIASNSLEQSNVDISNEFVKMITAQRGFQANSKIVTTVDAMLSDVIAMKR
ncbi:MAG: flagellar hook protein FlgE [Pseudomonadota bacterium]